jgi:hypothetical protein
MSARCIGLRVALGFVTLMPASPLAAQSLDELLAARRYDDAAASLENAAPEEARAGAMRIFNDVYLAEYQQERFIEAARGFEAVKQVPGLEDSVRQMLDFWHGMALFVSARDPALSEEEASSRLENARSLFLASEDYARRANLPAVVANVERALGLSGRARD